jgi:luciferase-like monooxygenase
LYVYLGLSYRACAELGLRAEERGFDGVFVVETYTTDAMAAVQAIALNTRRITVASGIANVYLRHPVPLGAGAVAIDEKDLVDAHLTFSVQHPPYSRWDLVLRPRDHGWSR